MDLSQLLKDHRSELASERSFIFPSKHFDILYIYEVIENSDMSDNAREELCEPLAGIVEIIIENKLRVYSDFRENLNKIIELEHNEALLILNAWRDAVSNARPSRKAIELNISRFVYWIIGSDTSARYSLLETLPQLAHLVTDIGEDGVQEIIRACETMSNVDDVNKLLSFIRRYKNTSADAVIGACRIANILLKNDCEQQLTEIANAITPEIIRTEPEAKKLFISVYQLGKSVDKLESRALSVLCEVLLAVIESNVSCAFYTATQLQKSLKHLEKNFVFIYLEHYNRLMSSIGIRVNVFSAERLPTFYRKYGLDRTNAFIEAATTVAKLYGITVAEKFIEQRTLAAKNLLSS